MDGWSALRSERLTRFERSCCMLSDRRGLIYTSIMIVHSHKYYKTSLYMNGIDYIRCRYLLHRPLSLSQIFLQGNCYLSF